MKDIYNIPHHRRAIEFFGNKWVINHYVIGLEKAEFENKFFKFDDFFYYEKVESFREAMIKLTKILRSD